MFLFFGSLFYAITGLGFTAWFPLAVAICQDEVHKFEMLLVTFLST